MVAGLFSFMLTEEIAYIGLGSNLNDPEKQIEKAIDQLKATPNIAWLQSSSFYHSPPWGDIIDQPDFVNAVVKISTSLSPRDLLMTLLTIEKAQGRVRRLRWGPRVLDCDILLYGEKIIHQEGLSIPHPYMHERSFVLMPLKEIAPDLTLPTGESIAALLERVSYA